MKRTPSKLSIALGAGLLVAITAIVVNLSNLPLERGLFVRVAVGDAIAGLVTVLVTLAIGIGANAAIFSAVEAIVLGLREHFPAQADDILARARRHCLQ